MLDEQLNILENLANLSAYEEDEAKKLWSLLLVENNLTTPISDQKEIRKFISKANKFADCTAITQ